MSKESIIKIADDAPITQADITSGRLVLRERGTDGAVLPGKRRINIFQDSVSHWNTSRPRQARAATKP
ncbi:MAG: hypothetical protein SCG79_00565 [Nitrosomonadaceae bacterium]|nr:hypothetical protein [Nitrosomonadaceae bacterium]MDW7597621.1 hypothetical protein [Nitrosomonadaceae bacterium]MDW7647234.1 hypothetical protein [Nitrosomonadaceae bacterium]